MFIPVANMLNYSHKEYKFNKAFQRIHDFCILELINQLLIELIKLLHYITTVTTRVTIDMLCLKNTEYCKAPSNDSNYKFEMFTHNVLQDDIWAHFVLWIVTSKIV